MNKDFIDFDRVNEQIDKALGFFEQEDTLTELISDVQKEIVILTMGDHDSRYDHDIYVSTHRDMLDYAKKHNNVVVYGSDDLSNPLVDAIFWIEAISPTGEEHILVVAGYVSTTYQ